jgi:nitrite reductase (NADH) small subunit
MPDLSTVTAPPVASLSDAGFHDVGAADDVPMLEGRRATVDGRRVAIFRLPTGFAATDAECPHRGGPLSDGLVADGCVTCPLHNWRLDLTTGTIGGEGDRMPIHDVVEDDGRLWVRLAADAGATSEDEAGSAPVVPTAAASDPIADAA